jgi:hypothetical protein
MSEPSHPIVNPNVVLREEFVDEASVRSGLSQCVVFNPWAWPLEGWTESIPSTDRPEIRVEFTRRRESRRNVAASSSSLSMPE